MSTTVTRIDLAASQDIAGDIRAMCDAKATDGYRLASTFVYGTQLILIFQKP